MRNNGKLISIQNLTSGQKKTGDSQFKILSLWLHPISEWSHRQKITASEEALQPHPSLQKDLPQIRFPASSLHRKAGNPFLYH